MTRSRIFGLSAAVLAVPFLWSAAPAKAQRSDQQVRQQIVRQSIAAYPGNCPCPYSTDRAGRRCGGRSAYSRPGGYAPKCYASDVSQAEVAAHRRR